MNRRKLKSYIWKHKGIILSTLASIGVVTTAIASGKAAVRVQQESCFCSDREKVELYVRHYAIPVLLGSSTVICIFGMNYLSNQEIKRLSTAYTMLYSNFHQYRDSLIELKGEKVDQQVFENITRRHSNFHQIDADMPDAKLKFKVPVTGEIIERYLTEVLDAEYHINRNYALRGYASVNQLLYFLGTRENGEPTQDDMGWTYTDGLQWIDFYHQPIELENGDICYEIVMETAPSDDYMADWIMEG